MLFNNSLHMNLDVVRMLIFFFFITDEQRLHALELNSWQLLNVLQVHLPGLLCRNLSYRVDDERDNQISGTISNTQEKLYHLFSIALAAHNLWKVHQQGSDFM